MAGQFVTSGAQIVHRLLQKPFGGRALAALASSGGTGRCGMVWSSGSFDRYESVGDGFVARRASIESEGDGTLVLSPHSMGG